MPQYAGDVLATSGGRVSQNDGATVSSPRPTTPAPCTMGGKSGIAAAQQSDSEWSADLEGREVSDKMDRVADRSIRGLTRWVGTRMECWRRRGTAVALLPFLCAATFVLGGCSFRGCDSTELAVAPIDRSGLDGPVTLEARLTSGGDPVRGGPFRSSCCAMAP